MPIQGTDNTNAKSAFSTFVPPAAEAQPQTAQRWSIFSDDNTAGLSRNGTNDILNKGVEILTEVYKSANLKAPLALSVLKVDNTQITNLRLSGIVVCVFNTKDKNDGVSYHTLILEGSGMDLESTTVQINGQPIQRRLVAGDVYDDAYALTVENVVGQAFPEMQLRNCSSQVIPREFKWEDKNAVYQLAMNSAMPCTTDMVASKPGFQDSDLTLWEKDAVLKTRLNFNEPDGVDYTGQTVRTSIKITMTAEAKNTGNQNNASINSRQQPKLLTLVGGFMDLMWAPMQAPQQYNPYMPNNAPIMPKFAPRFVMTNMESMFRMTPVTQLLSLVTALSLKEQNGWYPNYNPRHTAKGDKSVDLRDIGALNIEANITNDPSGYGKRIDTKVATFTNQELGKFLSMTVRPDITLSLDVPECGSSTWYNECFAAAASGNPKAQAIILRSADILTGGIFGKNYSGEAPVIVNEDRIHLGYCEGKDGSIIDIRTFDHLAVLNLQGDRDPAIGKAWSDTFLREDYPLLQRLDAREKMIVSMAGGHVHFKGFSRRVTFAGKFVETLAMSCRAAGLETQLTNPSFSGDYENQRASASFLGQSGMSGGMSGLFSNGFGPASASFGMGARFGQRF